MNERAIGVPPDVVERIIDKAASDAYLTPSQKVELDGRVAFMLDGNQPQPGDGFGYAVRLAAAMIAGRAVSTERGCAKPLRFVPCDDDMDGPIPEGACGAIGGAWPGLASAEHCTSPAAGDWNGLPLCFTHLRHKRDRP